MPDDRWSPEAQRYLDGEAPLPPGAPDRVPADRFVAALREWTKALPRLDEGVDDRVMVAVRRRSRARERAWWRWFIEPTRVAFRPALAAAAAVALVALSSLVTALLWDGQPPPTAVTPAAAPGNGTILVRFELRAPDAERVTLAGSFNGWSDSTIVFSRSAEPGVWSVTVALPPGRHQYLFVVDGSRWIPDPSAHALVEDEFGQQNSLLVVGPRGVVRS